MTHEANGFEHQPGGIDPVAAQRLIEASDKVSGWPILEKKADVAARDALAARDRTAKKKLEHLSNGGFWKDLAEKLGIT